MQVDIAKLNAWFDSTQWQLLKTWGSLYSCYKDLPIDNITDSESFGFKAKVTGRTSNDGNIKDVEISVR